MNPKASCGILYPPLHGIVQLTNYATPIVTFRLFAFVIEVSQIIAIAIPDDICFKHHIQIYRRMKHENK
jgi:hypothetical protein